MKKLPASAVMEKFLKGKDKKAITKAAKELAGKVMNTMKAEHGRSWLLWMGVEYEKVKAMSDEGLMKISEEVSTWKMKEPQTCSHCGAEM